MTAALVAWGPQGRGGVLESVTGSVRILMLGDIVGKSGRDAVVATLPSLVAMHSPDLVIANGENIAAGRGITPDAAQHLLQVGVHVVTLGNHVWDQRDIINHLEHEARLLRPSNFPAGTPGRGHGVYIAENGTRVGVANIMGRVHMEPLEDPFRSADTILESFRSQNVRVSLFDFHAEATSEKQAFGHYLDGRASAVVGTHTHVQTADERVLPRGTAYITDVGMTGPQHSVLGMDPEAVLKKFMTQRPHRFEVAHGPAMVNGVVVEVDTHTGRATRIERISLRDLIA